MSKVKDRQDYLLGRNVLYIKRYADSADCRHQLMKKNLFFL